MSVDINSFADLADIVADPRPPRRLLARLRALDEGGGEQDAAFGCALFETIHYRLPAFADDALPGVAARLYARAGRADAARLLAGLAAQLRPQDDAAPAADAEIAAKATAIIAMPHPGPALLLALEALDNEAGWSRAATLFEAVWPRVRPIAEYWVYHRMANVYGALGRTDACALLASLAIQIEPASPASDMPHRWLLRFFCDAGRMRDAADLCVGRMRVCEAPRLVDEDELLRLMRLAGPLLPSPPAGGRRDRVVIEGDVKPARPWRSYGAGIPLCLQDLQHDLPRDAITVSELRDAEMFVDHGAVAVFGPDGRPHSDLSLRCFPPLLRRRFAAGAAEEIEIDEAVLISDEFPDANLCHFLLDHATRLDIYRRAGARIGALTVIGPELRAEFQTVTAARMGVRGYFSVNRRARIRVERLRVSSNCHGHRHPAHWGAAWAVTAVRDGLDLTPRSPPRRLLISRRDSPWRRIANEDEVFALLEPLGFEIIVPGALAFADQIAAFRDATHVVGPHGAGLTNIVWCAPGTHVLEIFHPHYGTWAYAMLKDALGLDYATLVARDGDTDAAEFNDTTLTREQMAAHAGRDMRVDPGDLRRWIAESGLQ
jgi:hypothetical protein